MVKSPHNNRSKYHSKSITPRLINIFPLPRSKENRSRRLVTSGEYHCDIIADYSQDKITIRLYEIAKLGCEMLTGLVMALYTFYLSFFTILLRTFYL